MTRGSVRRRRPKALHLLVFVIAVLCAAFVAGGLYVTSLTGTLFEGGIGEHATLLLAFGGYLVVGLVLVSKLPRNPLGWVMTAIGVLTSIGTFTKPYAEYALAPPGHPLPGAVLAAWFESWWWFPNIALVFLFVPLLFPNGKPLTPPWGWLHRLAVAVFVTMVILAPLNPVLDGDTYTIANPLGVAAVGDIESSPVGSAVFLVLILATFLSLIAMILRFRRSRGVERQQMKWVLFGAALIIATIVIEEILKALELGHLAPDSNVLFGILVGLLPLTIGIAVMKYRLYDIDRIISRTLSYGLLTAVLLGLYLGAVAAITTVTAPFAGDSAIAVAAATLLAAAAFGPARRRIQGVVDRRFNRSRYDAERTVAALRGRLRDEVDLAALTAELLTVIDQSVQPQGTVLWLREGKAREVAP